MFIEWLAVMAPLVLSPGPINVIAALSGAQVGFKKSLPLFAGIHTVYLTYAIAMGFGIGALLRAFPALFVVMKYCGALFVIWLGVSMWLRSKQRSGELRLGYWDGFVLHALNPKYPVVLMTMYSAFLSDAEPLAPQILLLSAWILLLNVFTQAAWCGAGILIGRSLASEHASKIQDRIFATLLVLVGVWIAIR
jgi:threonine/homoserine/homoserine lactone efflux protein